jgi:hypothetical protein
MNSIFTLVIIICASTLICSIASMFVTEGSTKKVLNLVLGAFIICSLIVPIKNAVTSVNFNLSEYEQPDALVSSSDEVYSKEVLSQTSSNLESSVKDLLLQHNVKINSSKIILAQTDENSIIISSLCIYISKDELRNVDLISNIIEENFGVSPSIITE